MNSDPENPNSLPITGDAIPSVPLFTCIVYIQKIPSDDEQGDSTTVRGRVANLDGIEAAGSSEAYVLGKLTSEFKSRVRKIFESGQEIQLIDPPHRPATGELVRSIPMHL